MLNGWAAGAFDPPDTVNAIFGLAGSWVKPVAKGEGGTAVSYVTLEDDAKKLTNESKMLSVSRSQTPRSKTQLQTQKATRSLQRTDPTTSAGAAMS